MTLISSPKPRLAYSVTEAANVLGVSPKTLYNSIYNGTCPLHTVKFGGRRLVSVDQISLLLAPPDTGTAGSKPALQTSLNTR